MKNHVPTQNDEMFRRESRARDETAHIARCENRDESGRRGN